MSEIPPELQKMKPPRNTDEHTGAEPQTKKLGDSSRLRAFVVKPAPNLTTKIRRITNRFPSRWIPARKITGGSYTQPPRLLEDVRVEYCHRTAPDPGILACEAPAVYRPRHPEATVFYQTFEQHFDKYVAAYEQRFEPRSGPLRHVVPEAVVQFLACGRIQGGFARLRCPSCKSEHLVAFSPTVAICV